LAREDFRFQEAAEVRGSEGIETARGLIEKKDLRLMKDSANQTEALDGAGRESAHLAVESTSEFKSIDKSRYACAQERIG